jgi:hypothetical protein
MVGSWGDMGFMTKGLRSTWVVGFSLEFTQISMCCNHVHIIYRAYEPAIFPKSEVNLCQYESGKQDSSPNYNNTKS